MQQRGTGFGAEHTSLTSTDSCPTLVKYHKFGFTNTVLLKIITGFRCLNILLELSFFHAAASSHVSTPALPRADQGIKITCEHPGTNFHKFLLWGFFWWEADWVHGTSSPSRLQKEPPQQRCQGLCWPPQHKTDAQDGCAFLKLIAQQEKIL